MRYLFLLLLISTAQAAETVPDSRSPDGKWQIVTESDDGEGCYHVATRDSQSVGDSFPSDYSHLDQRLGSRVIWRRDSAFFVIEEPSSGIHQEFTIAQKTATGYSALPFDRFALMDSTKQNWHHAGVRFDRWLPRNRLAVTIYGDLHASRGDFECRFVLDLKDHFKVLSSHVIKPH